MRKQSCRAFHLPQVVTEGASTLGHSLKLPEGEIVRLRYDDQGEGEKSGGHGRVVANWKMTSHCWTELHSCETLEFGSIGRWSVNTVDAGRILVWAKRVLHGLLRVALAWPMLEEV